MQSKPQSWNHHPPTPNFKTKNSMMHAASMPVLGVIKRTTTVATVFGKFTDPLALPYGPPSMNGCLSKKLSRCVARIRKRDPYSWCRALLGGCRKSNFQSLCIWGYHGLRVKIRGCLQGPVLEIVLSGSSYPEAPM